MSAKLYDALVIGSGPAGLGMACSLARLAFSTLVIDSGVYRNDATDYIHGAPGLDYVRPADFRARTRADLLKHYKEMEFQDTKIKAVRKTEDGVFEAEDVNGVVFRGRKLGLATGVRDVLDTTIPGYADCWGRGVFHCLFCHGYEERGADSVGVLAHGLISSPEMLNHVTLMASRLGKSVHVYTNGNAGLAESASASLKSPRIQFDNRRIARLALRGDGPAVDVAFEDGSTRTEGFIASHPDVEQTTPFAAQLGLEMGPGGEIKVEEPFLQTSVPGCFAGGDSATMKRNVLQASAMGGFAGAGMAFQLNAELLDAPREWSRAEAGGDAGAVAI